MASSYTQPEDIQAELRSETCFSENTVPTLDTVRQWIEEESEQINRDVGYNYEAIEYTEDLDYEGQEYLMTLYSPIISITSLEYNQNRLGQTPSYITLTEDEDFSVYNDRGEILLLTGFYPSDGNKRFRIVYTAGETEVPTVVKKLTTKLTAQRVLNSLLSQNVNETNSGGTIKVGSITIVDPSNVSVGTYNSLSNEIDSLRSDLKSSPVRPRYQ